MFSESSISKSNTVFFYCSHSTILLMRFIFLGWLLSTSLCFAELPKPAAIPSPSELDIPYSADNPPGPSFTPEEKLVQMAEGQRIRREIIAAFNARRDSYTIAPEIIVLIRPISIQTVSPFALKGLHGDSSKPFRILGHGATFWFNLTDRSAPHYHQWSRCLIVVISLWKG